MNSQPSLPAGSVTQLVTENYELDVTAVQLHGSPAGRRRQGRQPLLLTLRTSI